MASEIVDLVPSRARSVAVTVIGGADQLPQRLPTAIGVPVNRNGPVPARLPLNRVELTAAGFDGTVGQALVVPTAGGPVLVAVGVGDGRLDQARLRDAAAAFSRAATRHHDLATTLADRAEIAPGISAEAAGQAVVEGIVLARYEYGPLRRRGGAAPVETLSLQVPDADADAVRRGVARGLVYARVTALARDLANAPPSRMTASVLASCAEDVGAESGLQVEVFDRAALADLGCGGLLGVNAGSAEEPRMVRLRYRPPNPGRSLTLVGKGVMYDSGGISLKPSDAVHATMKNDMSGAAAILAAMSALAELGTATAVTGYLMCTDNMPSGTAMKLGDVISIHGGTTVEVINTDAEGRLVMADALVLATEEPTDAIVDIATLTGACLRALGPEVAGVIGNDDELVARVRQAAVATDEPVWELPLARRYRPELDSAVADIKNMGGENAGAITAALFLSEFVGDRPWAHIDIAGTAQNATSTSWRPAGCTGFGARLLLELTQGFAVGAGAR